MKPWIPAFAAMTVGEVAARGSSAASAPPHIALLIDPPRSPHTVIPAKAGTHFDFASTSTPQRLQSTVAMKPWIPAFAGMTVGEVAARGSSAASAPPHIGLFIDPPRSPHTVIPAKAGTHFDFASTRTPQGLQSTVAMKPWIPAFAGMTIGGGAAA
ncbi:hypothetical protein RDV84_10185 [Lysobacter yananisis]|uniref:Uncharacterized protein n=1 Tax=Lysobacter yananisis TaxID=1003114 RepID=A0ABY9PH62_9GAMM|nr:hypothetical protein [Lysobacter yananisis]WMT05187.1 hypothetical protein RDV84_10185 [Lysobacter yananisis]